MTRAALVATIALVIAGCSDGGSTAPEPSHVLPTGTYDYAVQILRGLQDWRFEGTLTIAAANESQASGTWDVVSVGDVTDAAFEPSIVHGFFSVDAYVIAGEFDDGSTSGLITTRIALVDGEVRCTRGVYLLVFGAGLTDNGPLSSCLVSGPR